MFVQCHRRRCGNAKRLPAQSARAWASVIWIGNEEGLRMLRRAWSTMTGVRSVQGRVGDEEPLREHEQRRKELGVRRASVARARSACNRSSPRSTSAAPPGDGVAGFRKPFVVPTAPGHRSRRTPALSRLAAGVHGHAALVARLLGSHHPDPAENDAHVNGCCRVCARRPKLLECLLVNQVKRTYTAR